ncbi:PadR family transcriptional regulator [Kitasatospora azatica]|uniref:PadR family transcriptional regulator n=1 Tax=Kitasatospora azatica TaxID=58347 RepID=UPI00055BAC53|nr:PadR family transcriptional regulator [Kitasatospora azatica]
MSLPHAILTALLEKPSSGLELTRRFDKSIGFFWPATHQQIYRELGKLEQAGLIRDIPQPPSRGQRKEYEVLPEGRAALVAWTAERQEPKSFREPLLLRLRAAAVVGGYGLRAELERHLALHQQQLASYLAIEQHDFPPEQAATENRLQHRVLSAGIGLEQFWVEWLTETLAAVAAE